MKFERLIRYGLGTALVVGIVGGATPGWCEVSSTQVVEALEGGSVFAPGTRVTARLKDAEVVVSTYRNSKANDDDCKIEAVLAAKAIFDLEPEKISRVTVYFFEPTLTTFKQTSVSLGDVKAFASGELTKEKLIASIPLKAGEMDNVGKRVASYLNASRKSAGRRQVQTKIKGQDVEILIHIDGWLNDTELKLEAMRFATEALKAARGYKRVYITFADPQGEVEDRSVKFEEAELIALKNRLKEITDSIQLENGSSKWLPSERSSDDPDDLRTIRALPGILHGERKKILERLKDLAAAGVGVKPFLGIFFELEDAAARGDEDGAKKLLDRLESSISDQEKRHQSAKNFKPNDAGGKKSEPATKSGSTGGGDVTIGDSSMDNPEMRAKILANPAGQVNYWKLRYRKGSHGPHDFPNYARLLKTVIKVLKENNRPEAKDFEAELDQIKQKHPEWKF